jgi:hypothetical protein
MLLELRVSRIKLRSNKDKVKRLKTSFRFLILVLCLLAAAISTEANQSSVKTLLHEKRTALSNPEKLPPKVAQYAHFPERSYQFEPIVAGVKVSHDYAILNKGTDVLKIDAVKTSCGCTIASYPKQIPAGGRKKISIRLDTSGYGGKFIRKTIVVSTNDPKQPKVNLTIHGKVKKFAKITPKFARLEGKVGATLEQEITITPQPELPFKIKKIKAKKGEFIKYFLIEPEEKTPLKFILYVENTKPEAGRYADYIQLTTDSKIKRTLNIGVYGYIKAKPSNAP